MRHLTIKECVTLGMQPRVTWWGFVDVCECIHGSPGRGVLIQHGSPEYEKLIQRVDAIVRSSQREGEG